MTIKNPWLLFFGITIGSFLIGIDLLAIGVAIDPMRKALSIDIATLQWFLTAFAIGYSSFVVTSGRLADLYGKKRMLIIGILIFIATSATIAMTSSPLMIIIMRLIQGASGGILATVGIATLMSLYKPEERTKWIAGVVGVAGLGVAIGPAVGGVLIHYFSWRMIFLINLPLGLIGLLFTCLYVPTLQLAKKGGEKLDWIGVLLFTAMLMLFTIGINQGHYWGWSNEKTLLAFGLTLLILISFIYAEKKCSQPLIEFHLFTVKNFLAANIAGCILYFTMTAWILIFGIYLQRVAGMTSEQAGLSMLPFGIVLVIFSTQMGKLSKRFGAKFLIVTGYAIGVVAFFGMSMIPIRPPFWLLVPLFALYGVGFVFINGNSIPAALEFIPVEKAGIATGKSMMMRWLGGAIGAGVIATVFISDSSSWMRGLASRNGAFSSEKIGDVLHRVVTGQQNESLLGDVFQGSTLQEASSLVDQSYHHGLVASMLVLCGLCFLALLVSGFGIKKKSRS